MHHNPVPPVPWPTSLPGRHSWTWPFRIVCTRVPLVLVSWFLAIAPACAENLSVEAFFGHWTGMAIAGQPVAPTGVQYTRRDLDVTIARSGDGFSITWTALIGKRGAGGNAEDRRKSNTLAFHRKGPNSFEAEGAIGTGLGKSYSWARLDGSSLIMYILEIDEDGVYEVSRYARTISRSGEMELRFIRHRDGQLVRHVSAVLTLAR